MVITDLALWVGAALAAVPDPGTGTAPPGFGGIVTILGWGAYGVSAACVGGILMVAIMMALAVRNGQFSDHAKMLGSVLFACMLGAAASGLVGALFT